MIFPDRLAVIGVYCPTPNILKIIESTDNKAAGTILRSRLKWTVEFPIIEDVSEKTLNSMVSQINAQFEKMDLDAKSEIKGRRGGKLFIWGSSKLNEFMNELASKAGIIIFPVTHWEGNELMMIVGVFKGHESQFSNWISNFISDAPFNVNLKFYGLNNIYNLNNLINYLPSISQFNSLRYRWKLSENILSKEEFEIFKERWIGSPKFLSDDASKFIIKPNRGIEEEVIEIDAGESYMNDNRYFLENRYNILLNIIIKSLGNGIVENQILFTGRIHRSLYTTLNKLWKETDKEGIKHILYNLENVKVDNYNIGSIYSDI